jgi:hypothetical protein
MNILDATLLQLVIAGASPLAVFNGIADQPQPTHVLRRKDAATIQRERGSRRDDLTIWLMVNAIGQRGMLGKVGKALRVLCALQ